MVTDTPTFGFQDDVEMHMESVCANCPFVEFLDFATVYTFTVKLIFTKLASSLIFGSHAVAS